jgi:site-specific DNA-methyltransferase (adenine-specific)
MTREDLAEGVTLYCGDCREVLPTLGKFEAVITDPPYGVNFAEWDANFPADDYWTAISAAATDGANVIVIPGEAKFPEKFDILRRHFDYQWVIPWYKPNASQFGKTGYSKHSLIWWLSKGEPITRPSMIDVIVGYLNLDEDKLQGHPSPKPIRVMATLARNFAGETETILDPFMGSGTTGVAAVKEYRRFVGIEIEPKYFDISRRRISDALSRPDLFRPAARPIEKQQTLFVEATV